MFGRKKEGKVVTTDTVPMGLAHTLEEITRRYKKREALRFEGKITTYAEFDEKAGRVANGLVSLGIGKGDRVAMMLPNIPEFAFSFLGIQKLGAVAVPFNTMYKGREISFILKDCAAKAIICLSNFANLINEIKDDCPGLQHVIVTGQRTLVFVDPDATVNVQLVFDKSRFNDAEAAFRAIGSVMEETFHDLGASTAWYKHQGAVRAGGKKLATILLSEVENLYISNIVGFLSPMNADPLFKVVYVPPEVKDKVVEPSTSVSELAGKDVSLDEFCAALRKRVEEILGVRLEEGKLTRDELMAYEKNRALAHRV